MYDAVIIGGGPGGHTCAIRAAQLGGKVCIIEKNGLGGTCTQRGCIPTKFLHSMGDIMRKTSVARKNGLEGQIELNFELLRKKTKLTVDKLAAGIKMLLESNGIDLIQGEACIVSQNKVQVNKTTLDTKNIVIATGSHPICLPSYQFDNSILSTSTILELENLPNSIIIIGGGYSGCEFASILNALGSKVILIEEANHLIPLQIEEIGNTIERYMRLDGIDVMTRSRVDKIVDNKVLIGAREIEGEKILMCIGRKPNIIADELDKIDVRYNSRGIIVNEMMQTNVPHIFAIGDVTGMYELAHVASKQGEIAAQNIMGLKSAMDYSCVPSCIFTYPEVAFVGNLEGKIGEFPLAASAKASCLSDSRGCFKVFEKDGILNGAYIIAPHAGEMISEAALAIKMHLKIEDIYNTIHVHPTLPESFVGALKDINQEAIHLPQKRLDV
jgi:dihydrolipoamide dehydrogenase